MIARQVTTSQQEAATSTGKIGGEKKARRLEPGQPVEREIGGSEVHTYEIALDAQKFMQVIVEQRLVNVVVAVLDPRGNQIVQVDRTAGMPEIVPFIAEEAGVYSLTISRVHTGAPSGRYEVRIIEPREPREEDRSLAAAEKVLEEAARLTRVASTKPKALEKFEEALRLAKAGGSQQIESASLQGIAEIYHSRGEERRALEYFTRQLAIQRALGDRPGEGATLNDIGVAYNALGEARKAIEYQKQSLLIEKESGALLQALGTLTNIGFLHESLGEKQEALLSFNEGLRLARTLPAFILVSVVEIPLLNSAGRVLNSLGEEQKAFDYYNRALTNAKEVHAQKGVPDPLIRLLEPSEALTLLHLLFFYNTRGQHSEALDCGNQALTLYRSNGDRLGEVSALVATGRVYKSSGDNEQALLNFNQALTMAGASGFRILEAITLDAIGEAYSAQGKYDRALEYYNQALPIMRALKSLAGEAVTLYDMAKAERQSGSVSQARVSIEAALEIIESLRGHVAGFEFRSAQVASVEEYYEVYIDLLMHSPNSAGAQPGVAAFETAERARARSLLEGLVEGRADIRKGVDPSLLEQERSLLQLLNGKMESRVRLLNGVPAPEKVAALTKEIEALISEYHELSSEIRSKSPQYAALTQPPHLTLSEIQHQLLDADTLLLEYSLGDERSYLWAVTQNSFNSFQLPGRAAIETAARRVYGFLTARTKSYKTPAERRDAITRADAGYQEAAAVLSQMLLGPVATGLKRKRILIVADGLLEYIPFGALEKPEVTGPATDESKSATSKIGKSKAGTLVANRVPVGSAPRPLIADHEIVCLPSASALAALRRETAGRKPAPKLVAVIADPVFDRSDPRIGSAVRSQERRAPGSSVTEPERAPSSFADITRSTQDLGIGEGPGLFPRLPFTRQEAKSILSSSPRGSSWAALDFNANKATASSSELRQFRIVHFATHGLLNNKHPELSGLVFSLFDQKGEPQDGFLQLNDIYNLNLSADLVVLSACQTALGKEIKREGIVGLTRGFMYAGAARVMASLWKVDDEATADLMQLFYHGVIKKGLTPAAALRSAEIAMWKAGKWRSPFYWAGFVIYGEWH